MTIERRHRQRAMDAVASLRSTCYIRGMTKTLKDALHRVEAWPEHAQDMLAEFALQIDQELREGKYHATPALIVA